MIVNSESLALFHASIKANVILAIEADEKTYSPLTFTLAKDLPIFPLHLLGSEYKIAFT
jgi:hypothetical protein